VGLQSNEFFYSGTIPEVDWKQLAEDFEDNGTFTTV